MCFFKVAKKSINFFSCKIFVEPLQASKLHLTDLYKKSDISDIVNFRILLPFDVFFILTFDTVYLYFFILFFYWLIIYALLIFKKWLPPNEKLVRNLLKKWEKKTQLDSDIGSDIKVTMKLNSNLYHFSLFSYSYAQNCHLYFLTESKCYYIYKLCF